MLVYAVSEWADGSFCDFGLGGAADGYKEITLSQWQTIPEVAEWLREKAFSDNLMDHLGINLTEKVEEREIIGYKAPKDLFGKRIKKGTVFTKCAITAVSFEYIHGKTILPCEIVETWEPVYREEAARPKRKYMKQIWYVTEYDDDFGTRRVERFITKTAANDWTLENSVDDRLYKIETFEIVAYE